MKKVITLIFSLFILSSLFSTPHINKECYKTLLSWSDDDIDLRTGRCVTVPSSSNNFFHEEKIKEVKIITKSFDKDSPDDIWSKIVYENGKIKRVDSEYYEVSTDIYSYDDNGFIIELLRDYDPRFTFHFNVLSDSERERWNGQDKKKLYKKETIEKTKTGYKVTKEELHKGEAYISQVTEFFFNDFGNVEKIERRDNNALGKYTGTFSYHFTYDENGLLKSISEHYTGHPTWKYVETEITSYDGNNITEVVQTQYDANNNASDVSVIKLMDYDSYGNWTKQFIYRNKILSSSYVREISYIE